jgi:hypothetical protein
MKSLSRLILFGLLCLITSILPATQSRGNPDADVNEVSHVEKVLQPIYQFEVEKQSHQYYEFDNLVSIEDESCYILEFSEIELIVQSRSATFINLFSNNLLHKPLRSKQTGLFEEGDVGWQNYIANNFL